MHSRHDVIDLKPVNVTDKLRRWELYREVPKTLSIKFTIDKVNWSIVKNKSMSCAEKGAITANCAYSIEDMHIWPFQTLFSFLQEGEREGIGTVAYEKKGWVKEKR